MPYFMSMKKLNRPQIYEIVRFIIVGGLATVVDLTVTTVLVFITNLHENLITSVAFIIAFWVSYFGHRYFTFKANGSVVAFFLLAIATLILRNIIVYLLLLADIRGFAALITAMIIVTVITYAVAKIKIFKHN